MVRHELPFPSTLTWVSKRLTRDIVNLDVAKRHPGMRLKEVTARTPGVTPGVPFLEGTAERHEPTSVEDYAVKATEIVRRDTGSLQMPNDYIRMTLDFHLATFDVPFVWEERTTQRVSALFASQYVPTVGRVFVALFGSPHNILANREKEAYTGRTPSDADGLYRILHETREPEDVQLSQWTLDHPREVAYSDKRRADLAAEVIFGLVDPLPPRRLDVLAKPDVLVRDHMLGYARPPGRLAYQHDLIIIGAALWAGTPARQIDPVAAPGLSVAQAHLWPRFDTQLFEFLDERRNGGEPTVPEEVLSTDPETWRAYASWFVNLGWHLGQPTTEMRALRKPSRLNPIRYLSHGWRDSYNTKPTGSEGFMLRVGQRTLALVTASGDIFPVLDTDCIYWPHDAPKWLNPGEKPAPISGDLMEQTRLSMWEAAAQWRRRLPG